MIGSVGGTTQGAYGRSLPDLLAPGSVSGQPRCSWEAQTPDDTHLHDKLNHHAPLEMQLPLFPRTLTSSDRVYSLARVALYEDCVREGEVYYNHQHIHTDINI